MAVAQMVTLDGAKNISFLRISGRFMDTPSIYFNGRTICFVILQVQVLIQAL